MFRAEERFVPFEKKIWLSSPTMHGPELEYIKDAYEKNWMSTVGENINEVERLACETVGCKYAVALEKAFELYPEVRVVVMAHLYGTPGKIDELQAVCERHGAMIIEDAAESLGASYKGQQTGTFGTDSAISFNGACENQGTYISCCYGISDGYKLVS